MLSLQEVTFFPFTSSKSRYWFYIRPSFLKKRKKDASQIFLESLFKKVFNLFLPAF